jgi:hypothetical protein
MNRLRTATPLASRRRCSALGYLIGGGRRPMIAFPIAAGEFLQLLNATMVLSMHRAVEVDEGNAPEYYAIIRGLAARAGRRCPNISDRQSAAQRLATGRNPEMPRSLQRRAARTAEPEEVAAVMAHELAHIQHRDAHDDDHCDARRRDLDARQFRVLSAQPRQQQSTCFIGVLVAMTSPRWPRRCRWRSAGPENIPPIVAAPKSAPALALASADKIARRLNGSTIPTPSAIPPRRTSSSSIRCRANA